MHKYIQTLVFTGLVLAIACIPEFALAAETAYPVTVPQTMIIVVGHLFSLMVYIMFMALSVLDALLSPQFFTVIMNNGTTENSLLAIWQYSRDIVNVFFAILLVVLAFISVIKADLAVIKTNIGKLVAAIILVNFSWFGPRVVIDFANVLTATIYSLPSALNSSCSPTGGVGTCKKITKIVPYSSEAGESAAAGTMLNDCFMGTAGYVLPTDSICLKLENLEPSPTKPQSVFQGLLANYAGVMHAGKLPTSVPNATQPAMLKALAEIGQFFIKVCLNFLLTAAIAFPVIAMTAILLVRLFIMWITIAFMPFAFIGFLVGDKLGEANPMQIWTKFWHNALLPAVMAVPFAIGFIMMNALAGNNPCPFVGIADLEEICKPANLPVLNMQNWWELIMYLMAIAIIYFGFFAVLKFDSIAAKIGGFVKGIGDFALKAPLATPIPIPQIGPLKKLGDNFSLLGLGGIPGHLDQKLRQRMNGGRLPDADDVVNHASNNRTDIGAALSKFTISSTATIAPSDISTLREALTRANVHKNDVTENLLRDIAKRTGVSNLDPTKLTNLKDKIKAGM